MICTQQVSHRFYPCGDLCGYTRVWLFLKSFFFLRATFTSFLTWFTCSTVLSLQVLAAATTPELLFLFSPPFRDDSGLDSQTPDDQMVLKMILPLV